jgi:hypothetical protein
MSEEIILRSYSTEIPVISVGEYLVRKLEKLEDKTCLVSKNYFSGSIKIIISCCLRLK